MELNDPVLWVIAGAAVLVVVLVVLLVVRQRRRRERTDRLRERFGQEYDRTVARAGSRSDAEDQLEQRLVRRDRMQLRDLSADQRQSYLARWEELQTSFVDGPASALRGADVLLDDVALARGYPDASSEQRLDDLAVEHSDEVHVYRNAARGPGDDAERDRRSMLAARGLFEALLGPEPRDAASTGADAPEAPFERVLGETDDAATHTEPAADPDDRSTAPDRAPPPTDDPVDRSASPDRAPRPADDPVARSERHALPADEAEGRSQPPDPTDDPRPRSDQHRVPPPPPPDETR